MNTILRQGFLVVAFYCIAYFVSAQSKNTFYGTSAGAHITTGSYNSFFGSTAGYFNSTGVKNTFIGSGAGMTNNGNYNTFTGFYAGIKNTTGSYNSFYGTTSGGENTTGSYNTFSGTYSGTKNTTGSCNSFYGLKSGYLNTTGSYNTFLGFSSGLNNKTGIYNTYLGDNAGANNTSGSFNVFIGHEAGATETGSNKLYIANVYNNTLIYGDFANKRVAIGKTSANYTLDVNGSGSFSSVYTETIYRMNKASFYKSARVDKIVGPVETIKSLRGMIVEGNQTELKNSTKNQNTNFGFNPTELANVLPGLVVFNEESNTYGIDYDGLIPILVEALKAQQEIIESHEAKISALENGTPGMKSTSLVSAELLQNTPNPFTFSTSIGFILPAGTASAVINVYNMQGKPLKTYNVTGQGESSLEINNDELGAGMYLYSLIVDGQEIGTKRMIILE